MSRKGQIHTQWKQNCTESCKHIGIIDMKASEYN